MFINDWKNLKIRKIKCICQELINTENIAKGKG